MYLRELVEAAQKLSSEQGDSGRVRWRPNERLVRYYSTEGLMDKPLEKEGRKAVYGINHLLQLLAIKALQSQGLSLEEIKSKITVSATEQLQLLAGLPEDWEEHLYGDSVDICDSGDEDVKNNTVNNNRKEGETTGMVITFHSAKAGVGATTTAVNFATVNKAADKSVVLVDLDLDYGDVALYMNLSPDSTLSSLFTENKSINRKCINDILKSQGEKELQFLLAPKDPVQAEDVDVRKITKIIDCLRQEFDLVVIDLPGSPTGWRLDILRKSDKILHVVDQNLSRIKNAKLSYKQLAAEGIEDKVDLVLNKACDEWAGITPNDVSAGLRHALTSIPRDMERIAKSCNDGVPFLTTDDGRESDYGKAIAKLSRAVTCLI